MPTRKKKTVPDILILVAPYFEEKAVVYCLSKLRQQGFMVSLVSVTPGQVQSQQGVGLCPDASLSQADELVADAAADKPQLVLLAGGSACAAVVLADPRTHRLVERVLHRGGYVAAMAETFALIKETGLLRAEWGERFLRQEGEVETAVFVQQITNRLNTTWNIRRQKKWTNNKKPYS